MKITGPGSPALPPDAAGVPDAAKASKPGGAAPDKTFAERVQGASPARPAAAAVVSKGIVADITAELKSGALTPDAAVEKVLDRVLARQLGTDAPAPVREQVRAALREAIASDPLLADRVRALTG